MVDIHITAPISTSASASDMDRAHKESSWEAELQAFECYWDSEFPRVAEETILPRDQTTSDVDDFSLWLLERGGMRTGMGAWIRMGRPTDGWVAGGGYRAAEHEVPLEEVLSTSPVISPESATAPEERCDEVENKQRWERLLLDSILDSNLEPSNAAPEDASELPIEAAPLESATEQTSWESADGRKTEPGDEHQGDDEHMVYSRLHGYRIKVIEDDTGKAYKKILGELKAQYY